jgi:MarR family 2-MHQ and catechol resistance regulon transcriptional repressor
MGYKGRVDALSRLSSAVVDLVLSGDCLHGALAEREGLNRTALEALVRSAEAEQITPKDLAHRMRMTNGAITAVTDRLVAAGYLARSPHPQDRRSVLLAPTQRGLEIVERTSGVFRDAIKNALSAADDDALPGFAASLSQISDKMVAASERDPA